MKKELVVITIPIYKSEVDDKELASLLNCIKILINYKIVFLAPKSLNTQFYQDLCVGLIKFNIEKFNDAYFSNLYGYNKLLINNKFYSRFKKYEYILIFQLDAWVFRDDLTYWCKQGYDYIGAPWYEGWAAATTDSKFVGVGNGGLSLRKVSSHLKVLRSFSYVESPLKLSNEILLEEKHSIKSYIKILLNFTIRNNTFFLFNNFFYNEDRFWGEISSEKFNWFKVPDEVTASKFSMEMLVPTLYLRNNKQLPFGCHGWFKYYQEFWGNHIEINR
jgi:hypothetical protein